MVRIVRRARFPILEFVLWDQIGVHNKFLSGLNAVVQTVCTVECGDLALGAETEGGEQPLDWTSVFLATKFRDLA